jgi:GNAT superfamily N-acetyltransferase
MTQELTDDPADAYVVSEDPARQDLERTHRWLSEDAYWALGRPRDVHDRAFAASAVVGIYAGEEQVAVARIVSDGATFAWLCDVYVDRAHRGLGLGRRLAAWAVAWSEERGVPRIVLATLDAHDVYATAGFQPVDRPERYMEIDRRGRRF